MPARLAARFECDEILMPQLVDDLPRRDAALSWRAGDEHVATGPRGEVRQRPRNETGWRRGDSPNGTLVDIVDGSVISPVVNGASSWRCVSNVKIAALSREGSSQLSTCSAASRAFGRCPYMLPLTSNITATLT